MRVHMVLPGLLLLLTALAGCTADPAADDEQTAPAPPVPVAPAPETFVGTIVNDHATGASGHVGHQVAALHEGSHNLELLDHDDLGEGNQNSPSGFTELHVVEGLAVVASLTGTRGVTLVDVSDASDLRVLSHITNLDDNWDARLSQDLQYLFVGCQGSGAFDCTGIDTTSGEGAGTTGGGPCVPLATCPGGIAVYAIDDPTLPQFLGYLPMGFTHNVFTYMDEGIHYFINAGGTIAAFDPVANTFTELSSDIDAVHDIAVQKHPLTGQWLLYTGANDYMSIWDLKDPAAPALLSTIDEEAYDEAIPPMWHEQTPMPCLLDGRHITIGAGERSDGLPQPVGVVDTTDPTNPVYLGQWRLPDADDLTAQMSYRFSLHNVDGNCQGQVAVGHYHAGVWVFDVSTKERQAAPVTLAYYQPHAQAVTGWSPAVTAPIGALASSDSPNVWAAQWAHNGTVLLVPDMTTGLYSLAPQWTYE